MKKLSVALIPFLLSILISPQAHAFDSENIEFLGAWPYGAARGVAYDSVRDLGFFGSGGIVVVVDVSDPGNPVTVSEAIRTRGVVEDLFYDAANQLIFVAGGKGGLEIWDVAISTSPQFVGRHDVMYFGVEAPVHAVAVKNTTAYVAADFGLVHWLDVSDPSAPVDFGFNGAGGNPSRDLYLDGNFLYVAGPDFIRYAINPNGSLSNTGFDINLSQSSSAVFVSENRAYLLNNGDLIVLDLTQIFFPVLGFWSGSNSRDVFVDGSTAYVADPFLGLRVLDVTNPALISEIGSESVTALDVHVFGNNAYVSGGSEFQIVSVTDPTLPAALGSITTKSLAYDIEEAGGYVYVANSTAGFTILDVANPANSIEVGSLGIPDIGLDVTLGGNYAYVASRYSGLRIIDISSPASPVEVGSHTTPDYARGVAYQSGYAYVVDLSAGLRVIDVADPANPVEVGSVSLPASSGQVAVQGNYAYVANGSNGFRVVDISNPVLPLEVASISTSDYVASVFVSGNRAFIADFGGGLRIINIANPSNPNELGSYAPAGITASGVFVSGDTAYVTDQGSGLIVLDVSNSNNPVEIGSHETPGSAFRVFKTGSGIHVADGTGGVQIYRHPVATTLPDLDPTDFTPGNFTSMQAFPNPARSHTSISYRVAGRGDVNLSVYDLRGALVKTLASGPQTAGRYQIEWNGLNENSRPVSSGIYFVRLSRGGVQSSRKVVIAR